MLQRLIPMISALLLSLAALPAPAQEPPGETASIIVNVVNADPPTGTLEISLFNSAESFMHQPLMQLSGPPREDGSHVAAFRKVPYGDYAVVVVHDSNGNGKLDTGFLGIGGEPYAYSNDARPLFGRPDFDAAKFRVNGDTTIRISME